MIVVHIILFAVLLLCPPPKFCGKGSAESGDYLAAPYSLPIKGACVVAVFIAHFTDYVTLHGGAADGAFLLLRAAPGQLIVVMFFFYSGFGIVSRALTRPGYVRRFPVHRALPVWLRFAVVVAVYIAVNACFGIRFGARTTALAFTGWTSVGNSNWFMFVTFALYVLFYLSFRFTVDKKPVAGMTIFTVLAAGLTVFLRLYARQTYWYGTLPCFVMGGWLAFFKDKIDGVVMKNRVSYCVALAAAVLAFAAGWLLKEWHRVFYVFYAAAFAAAAVIVTMKVRFRSKPLAFLGKHVFAMYIWQRLILRTFAFWGLNAHPLVYFVVCFVFTTAIALLFDKCWDLAAGAVKKRICTAKNK